MQENIMISVLTVKDIQDILKISKNTAYGLVRNPPFPVKIIKGQYRIPEIGFNRWLMEGESPA